MGSRWVWGRDLKEVRAGLPGRCLGSNSRHKASKGRLVEGARHLPVSEDVVPALPLH